MSPLTGDRELEAILPPAGVCREPEFTRGVDREAVLGSAGGLLTLPFGIAQGTELRPVIHSGSFIGTEVSVWDIADKFGDTNLLVHQHGAGERPREMPRGEQRCADARWSGVRLRRAFR